MRTQILRLLAPAVAATAILGAATVPAQAAGHGTSLAVQVNYSLAGAPINVNGAVSGPTRRTVALQQYLSGAWRNLATTRSDTHGHFAMHPVAASSGSYVLRIAVPAAGAWAATDSKTFRLNLAKSNTPLSLSNDGPGTTVEWGTPIFLELDGAIASSKRTVYLQQWVNGTWQNIAVRNYGPGSDQGYGCDGGVQPPYQLFCHSITLQASTVGKFSYRMYAPATATANAGTSHTLTISVVSAAPEPAGVSVICSRNGDGTEAYSVDVQYYQFRDSNGDTTPVAPAPWTLVGGTSGSDTEPYPNQLTYDMWYGLDHALPGQALPPITLAWKDPQTGIVHQIPTNSPATTPALSACND